MKVSFLAQLDFGILCLQTASFPLAYELNGRKSRINSHLLTAGSFLTDFMYALIFLLFLVTPCLAVTPCSALLGVNPIKAN